MLQAELALPVGAVGMVQEVDRSDGGVPSVGVPKLGEAVIWKV